MDEYTKPFAPDAGSRSPELAGRDHVFVERLWCCVKYEEVYLHAYDSVSAARNGIGRYLDFYNRRRPHSSLDGRAPDAAYFQHESMPPIRLAA